MTLEFYANLLERKDNKVNVHSVLVTFRPKAINAYFKTPNIPEDDDQFFKFLSIDIDYEGMANSVTIPISKWTRIYGRKYKLHKEQLQRYLKEWMYFIALVSYR